ncbi:MAG: ABC transporter ATP-binding protein [Anaerolineales bacterium]|nr:ABC transporter ATP-binding protein [Anaerolineales bacterium]
MQTAINLHNISVQYRAPEERIGTFKEYAIRLLQKKIKHKTFLALNDISLEIKEGDTFGILGRNGAGKSTLLKVISRVLAPTKGRVQIRGRVSPLLELGAGFHPELTGRENIFLNGALLGHSYHEIEARLESIIKFSEIEGFIEAPIRTYSTGMVARLGFAVATAWKPEILILDEVLSVGDEAFQQKCQIKLDELRSGNVTTILVSHNVNTMQALCTRAIWLDHGEVRASGDAARVIQIYKEQNL